MIEQTLVIPLTGEKTVFPIKAVNPDTCKVQFLDYEDPRFRCYFQDSEHLVIEGGKGIIRVRLYEIT